MRTLLTTIHNNIPQFYIIFHIITYGLTHMTISVLLALLFLVCIARPHDNRRVQIKEKITVVLFVYLPIYVCNSTFSHIRARCSSITSYALLTIKENHTLTAATILRYIEMMAFYKFHEHKNILQQIKFIARYYCIPTRYNDYPKLYLHYGTW